MAETLAFELVSPERLLLSEQVEMVVVPGAEGDFGALPGHAPMISSVRAGVISTWNSGAVAKRIFVAGGFAEVTPERCTLLAEEAVPLDDDDAAAGADARLAAARNALENAEDDRARDAARRRLSVAEALRSALRNA